MATPIQQMVQAAISIQPSHQERLDNARASRGHRRTQSNFQSDFSEMNVVKQTDTHSVEKGEVSSHQTSSSVPSRIATAAAVSSPTLTAEQAQNKQDFQKMLKINKIIDANSTQSALAHQRLNSGESKQTIVETIEQDLALAIEKSSTSMFNFGKTHSNTIESKEDNNTIAKKCIRKNQRHHSDFGILSTASSNAVTAAASSASLNENLSRSSQIRSEITAATLKNFSLDSKKMQTQPTANKLSASPSLASFTQQSASNDFAGYDAEYDDQEDELDEFNGEEQDDFDSLFFAKYKKQRNNKFGSIAGSGTSSGSTTAAYNMNFSDGLSVIPELATDLVTSIEFGTSIRRNQEHSSLIPRESSDQGGSAGLAAEPTTSNLESSANCSTSQSTAAYVPQLRNIASNLPQTISLDIANNNPSSSSQSTKKHEQNFETKNRSSNQFISKEYRTYQYPPTLSSSSSTNSLLRNPSSSSTGAVQLPTTSGNNYSSNTLQPQNLSATAQATESSNELDQQNLVFSQKEGSTQQGQLQFNRQHSNAIREIADMMAPPPAARQRYSDFDEDQPSVIEMSSTSLMAANANHPAHILPHFNWNNYHTSPTTNSDFELNQGSSIIPQVLPSLSKDKYASLNPSRSTNNHANNFQLAIDLDDVELAENLNPNVNFISSKQQQQTNVKASSSADIKVRSVNKQANQDPSSVKTAVSSNSVVSGGLFDLHSRKQSMNNLHVVGSLFASENVSVNSNFNSSSSNCNNGGIGSNHSKTLSNHHMTSTGNLLETSSQPISKSYTQVIKEFLGKNAQAAAAIHSNNNSISSSNSTSLPRANTNSTGMMKHTQLSQSTIVSMQPANPTGVIVSSTSSAQSQTSSTSLTKKTQAAQSAALKVAVQSNSGTLLNTGTNAAAGTSATATMTTQKSNDTSLENRVFLLESKLLQLKSKTDSLEKTNLSLNQEIKSISNQRDHLKRENQDTKARIADLESAMRRNEEGMTLLFAMLQRQQNDVETLKDSNCCKQQMLPNHLQQKNHTQDDKSTNVFTDVSCLESPIEQIPKQYSTLDSNALGRLPLKDLTNNNPTKNMNQNYSKQPNESDTFAAATNANAALLAYSKLPNSASLKDHQRFAHTLNPINSLNSIQSQQLSQQQKQQQQCQPQINPQQVHHFVRNQATYNNTNSSNNNNKENQSFNSLLQSKKSPNQGTQLQTSLNQQQSSSMLSSNSASARAISQKQPNHSQKSSLTFVTNNQGQQQQQQQPTVARLSLYH